MWFDAVTGIGPLTLCSLVREVVPVGAQTRLSLRSARPHDAASLFVLRRPLEMSTFWPER